jgi:thiol-disulfide isomerase/thioredoxin
MNMRSGLQLLLLLQIIAASTYAQKNPSSLNIGDPAPQLSVRKWIKGNPVQRFEHGKVYVLEFWATWCSPCIAAMPHLSILAREYKDKVSIAGIDIYEQKTISTQKIKAFVDSLSDRIDYAVAAGDSNMVSSWIDASGTKEEGIPVTFVINATGRLAWIGHPKDLAEVLKKIVNNTWNIKEALVNRNADKRLAELDKNANYDLMKYWHDSFKPDFVPKPDSALLAINEIVKNDPKLKYAPFIAYNTFSGFLLTNPQKAYEYGKTVIVTSTYEEPAYSSIYDVINNYSDKLNLPAQIYLLGAEAYQAEIDQLPYPEIANTSKFYHSMASFYWRANEKTKAIGAEEKAIGELKNKKDFSKSDLAVYELQLEHYKQR